MGELKDLVPPLELCKLIPEGKFADSVFEWYIPGKKVAEWRIVPCVITRHYSAASGLPGNVPAPTTDEILAELAKFPHYFNNAMLEIDKDAFIVGAFKPNRGKPGSHLTENRDARPVVAALRLYLGLSDPSEASDKTPDAGHTKGGTQ